MEDIKQFYLDIGERVKIIRKAKKWSQSRLAEKSGLSQSYVSEIESGKARITIDVLVDICNAFGVTPNILLDKMDIHIDAGLGYELHRMDPQKQKKLYEVYLAVLK